MAFFISKHTLVLLAIAGTGLAGFVCGVVLTLLWPHWRLSAGAVLRLLRPFLAAGALVVLLAGGYLAYQRWKPWHPSKEIRLRTGSGPPQIAGCPIFPADNYWNTPVDQLPVAAKSAVYISTIGTLKPLHADFGGPYQGKPVGIPYAVVNGSQTPKSRVIFEFDDESDSGEYPIPPGLPIEGDSFADGDRHSLLLDRETCRLYELFGLENASPNVWNAGSGAIYDLRSNHLRPNGWTSADAAGLPMLAGMVRYQEVEDGEIRHALRFSARTTRKAHLWPARHHASPHTEEQYPPMGLRVRLKSSFDISGFHPAYQVIFGAMQRYGMVLSDNGGDWFVSGTPDDRWANRDLNQAFSQVHGSDFEVVDTSAMLVTPDSAQSRLP